MTRETRLLMGMPITIEVSGHPAAPNDIEAVFAYFTEVDATFSTYKPTSEISQLNRGELTEETCSKDMQTVLALCEETRRLTHGYFDLRHGGMRDPSGIVKGWAIQRAAGILRDRGYWNFYIDAGGDIALCGVKNGRLWQVGIRNPFDRTQHVKVLSLRDRGIATSGTAIRGQHIYDPHTPDRQLDEIVSLTVIGPNVYEADRFATAAFAMGRHGIRFIEEMPGFEGYQIDVHGVATATSGFERYVAHP